MRRGVMVVVLLVAAAGAGLAAQPATIAGPASVTPGRVREHITAIYDRQGNRIGGDGDAVSGDSLYWKDYYTTTYLKSSAKDDNPAPADRTAMQFQNEQTVVSMDPTGDYVYEVYGSTMRRFSTVDGSYTSYTLTYGGNGACATDGQYVYVPSGHSIHKYTIDGTYVNTTPIDFSTNTYAFGVANETLWAGEFNGITYYGYACARFDGDSLNYDVAWTVGGGTGGAGMNIAFDGTYYYWAMGGFTSNSFKRFYADRTPYTEGMVSTDCRGVMCKIAASRKDVACAAILAPEDSVDSGEAVTPRAVIRNVGTSEETFDAWFSIGTDYADTIALTLAAGETDTAEFDAWDALELGTFAVACSTMLADDVNADNDAVHDSVEVVPFTGIGGRSLPAAVSCEGVQPNPTNGRATIRYGLPGPAEVTLSVYSSAGALVRTLLSGARKAGRYQVSWDTRDEQGRRAEAGVYLLRLEAGGFLATRKLVVQR